MTYFWIFTIYDFFKPHISPKYEVTFDINIGLTVYRKAGSKDTLLNFTRTK